MNPKCFVVPDVHGRGFWRILKTLCPMDTPIVFLGDYLDPYGFEGISPMQAVDVFKEVIEFRKENPNVTLLIGNHDCTYLIGRQICDCRCNYEQYDEIRKLFNDNIELFGLTKDIEVGGKKFILSHAGIHPSWLQYCNFTTDDIPMFNERLLGTDESAKKLRGNLSAVSYYRGGILKAGSPIWADIREYDRFDLKPLGFHQIVGHTYVEKPIVMDEIVCVDVQKVFCLDEYGDLYNYETKELVKQWKKN